MSEKRDDLKARRLEFADRCIAAVDTVTLLSCEEVDSIRARALSGEFDADVLETE